MAAKYKLLARIRGDSNNLDSSNIGSWFVCGHGTENAKGEISIKLLGLPLPGMDWNGWLYLRESKDFTQEQAPIPQQKKNIHNKDKSKNKTEFRGRDDDIPF